MFYNTALAVVPSASFAALCFRLLPPLSPEFRARQLLALTLRDLRRLARERTHGDWEDHANGRLLAMPNEARPLQRAQLLTALSVGGEIVRLRQISRQLDLGAALDVALNSLAAADSSSAILQLTQLDAVLAARTGAELEIQAILRSRGSILALSEALTQHAVYFETGASR